MKTTTILLAGMLLTLTAHADDQITRAQIEQVMLATDAASSDRDAARIGDYLGESFEKVLEFTYKKWIAKVRIDKEKYLNLIDEGWAEIYDYSYQRENTEIHLANDGSSGESYSTVVEHLTRNGEPVTSRFREYATYRIENGKPVITEISGHTLLGDTTPQY